MAVVPGAELQTLFKIQFISQFYQSDVGKKWSSHQPVMTAQVFEMLHSTPEMATNLFAGMCIAEFVAEGVESLQRKQLSLGEKPTPVDIDTVMEKNMPLVISSENRCSCFVDKMLAKSESKNVPLLTDARS